MDKIKAQFHWFAEKLPEWNHDAANNTLSADNIVLYFREEYKEWRLKDTSRISTMDLVNISPFVEHDILIIKRKASAYHKG